MRMMLDDVVAALGCKICGTFFKDGTTTANRTGATTWS
jgi:hypothetical protein